MLVHQGGTAGHLVVAKNGRYPHFAIRQASPESLIFYFAGFKQISVFNDQSTNSRSGES